MAQTKAMHTNSSRSVAAQQTARNASSTAATAWPCRLATGALGHFLAMMVSAGNAAHLSFLAPETLVVRSALKMDSSNRGALTARSAWHGGRGMHASCSPVLAGANRQWGVPARLEHACCCTVLSGSREYNSSRPTNLLHAGFPFF